MACAKNNKWYPYNMMYACACIVKQNFQDLVTKIQLCSSKISNVKLNKRIEFLHDTSKEKLIPASSYQILPKATRDNLLESYDPLATIAVSRVLKNNKCQEFFTFKFSITLESSQQL
jgi:hypothetical protein